MKSREIPKDFLETIEEKRPTIQKSYCDFIIKKKAENCTDYTIRYYDVGVEKLLSRYDVKYVDELTQERVSQITVSEKEANPSNSIRTLNTKLMALRTFIYYCQEKELLPKYKIKLLKSQEAPKETYTNEELKILIKKPKTLKWTEWRTWAVVNYLISTGNRASSILNIKIRDIDFSNRIITLTHTKNKKSQIVPLSESMLEVLDIYLKTFEWTEDDYLFPTTDGHILNYSSLRNDIAHYNKKRGVSKTSIHLFRHTFAKNYLLAGGSVTQLQHLLGHAKPTMSLHYAQIFGIEEVTTNYDKLNPLNQLL